MSRPALRRPCIVCGTPTIGPRCERHKIRYGSRWPESKSAYGADWAKLRNAYIAEHPVCELPGCHEPAKEVDHIVPVRVDPSRRLDPSNLRALCLHHHRSITARQRNRYRKR